ncbi:MAG: hypothetical protein LBL09_01880 [Oscillospiraceae bacterium]|jgi:CBS domain containing-hemolysin-like protein|nr:hypothetical protein [Oscillospiraceae bacterium]
MEDSSSGKPRLPKKDRGQKKSVLRWAVKLFVVTIFISMFFSLLSQGILKDVGYLVAFFVLAFFILLGIIFDIIGVAVTSASEPPFNSMASRKVAGAREAIILVRRADKVSSFCNDVVGDISGIISGSTGALIAAALVTDFSVNTVVVQLIISGLVSGFTVGGKALGKGVAISHSTRIVHFTGKLIFVFKSIFLRSKK